MRILLALAAMTTPALAHTAPGAHLHGTDGVWIAAMAVATGLALSARVVVQAARAKA